MMGIRKTMARLPVLVKERKSMTQKKLDRAEKKIPYTFNRLETLSSDSCEYCGEPLILIRFKVFDQEITLRPACECRIREQEEREEQARLEELRRNMRQQGLEDGLYAHMRLDQWENRDASAKSAAKKLESYLDNVQHGVKNWLYLFGGYGLGKTYLGVSALHFLCLERRWEPLLIRWSEYCSRIQQVRHDANAGSEYDLWCDAVNARVLVLDDIDKRASSEWALGKLFELVDHRYLYQLPTVLIANRGIEELAGFWGKTELMQDLASAIISRILGQLLSVIEFSGNDFRLQE